MRHVVNNFLTSGIYSSDGELNKLRGRLDLIKRQLDATAEHLTKLPSETSPVPIFEQMKKLELQKSEIELELNELSAHRALNPPVELADYKSLLQKIRHGLGGADDALKARIVTTLIKRIEILPASIRVHYRMGKGGSGDIGSRFDLANGGARLAWVYLGITYLLCEAVVIGTLTLFNFLIKFSNFHGSKI